MQQSIGNGIVCCFSKYKQSYTSAHQYPENRWDSHTYSIDNYAKEQQQGQCHKRKYPTEQSYHPATPEIHSCLVISACRTPSNDFGSTKTNQCPYYSK